MCDPLVDDLLFFARVRLFEEIVDSDNLAMAGDQRLAGVARAINQRHHLDERRHLAFGRRVVRRLGDQARQARTTEDIAFVARELDAFLTATWREYYNPRCYRDAGVPEPWLARHQGWEAGWALRTERSRRPAPAAGRDRAARPRGGAVNSLASPGQPHHRGQLPPQVLVGVELLASVSSVEMSALWVPGAALLLLGVLADRLGISATFLLVRVCLVIAAAVLCQLARIERRDGLPTVDGSLRGALVG
jgi:hypothetical protein